ncbi:NB-ARC domain-containing protein [Asanoa sp. WMMD1127]|uniref:helix-turn-helix domain-containing protein n=1 Tax=Asanoa sp. WMMD1127 TaxID=3016107 RepID=UPI0024179036|nr:helix-turn-helix domain-containing protein [Asanoa sp. WMMD1127]MDG4825034.1 NB-ARC domain-containing protein [Asanoa sp. WMMD1127]
MLLRRHRLHRHLTQEELAERAGITSRSVGAMEGGRSPRLRTVEQLANALDLTGATLEEFASAGRALFWDSRPDRDQPATRPAGFPSPATKTPRQLPADLSDFVARQDEISLIQSVLDPNSAPAKLVVLSGPAGAGKTALAVHASHRVSAWFPDGHLYVALQDAGGHAIAPVDVLGRLLRDLGTDRSALPAGVDERVGLLRTRLASRRMLLVLDDARGYRQVEPFMPIGSTAVLVTSRMPLTGLPGATSIDLSPLPTAAAVDLLCRVAGTERVRAEPAAAKELVRICGGLPLAVRIAAARLAARPHWTVAALTERLAAAQHRLDELRHGDLAVRPGLELAYKSLSPTAADAFALLGRLDMANVPGWLVTAMLGLEPSIGDSVIEELVDARLLDDLGPDSVGHRRYRLHEITRLYAAERQAAENDPGRWTSALARAAEGWLALVRKARDRLHCERLHLDDGDQPAAALDSRAVILAEANPRDWFESEREALVTIVDHCADAGLSGLAQAITGASADFFELRGYYDDWRRTMLTALRCCRRTGDRRREASMLRGLGGCLVELDDQQAALSTLREAHSLAVEVDDRAGAAMTRKEIGFVLALSGHLAEAETELRNAVEELGRVDRRSTEALALTNLGFVLRQKGESAAAVALIRTARDIARSENDLFAEAYTLRVLAGALLPAGRRREAEQAAETAAELFTRIGDPIGAAQSLRVLGEALAQSPGRRADAEKALSAAATMFRDRMNYWGLALTDLTLGEIGARHGADDAVDLLERSLRYWTDEQVPALRARALMALAVAAEHAGDPKARRLEMEAHRLYRDLGVPSAGA